jgi:hypothetical protein
MAADIVPIGLALDDRDVFTLWAPRWRDAGDEWEAFLGKDEDLYAFESVPDLVAFVRADNDNDLADHPSWGTLAAVSAHELDPDDDKRFDLIRVYELLAEKPTQESVEELQGTLAMVSAIGSVCELPPVTKFFNGNPVLSSLSGGIDNFSDKAGLRRWHEIGALVEKSWDKVVDAIDNIISTPDVDSKVAAQAEAELLAANENEIDDVDEEVDEDSDEAEAEAGDHDRVADDEDRGEEAEARHEDDEGAAAQHDNVVLGGDQDFWLKVGIDPIRMMTSAGTFYTLRCYLNDAPVFLGRNGRISVFGSERSLARYLADEHDHDLSDLATYDDIRAAATDGSLRIDVTDDNVYVLTGLSDDLRDGPEAVDREQLELAVELLRDVGEYSEDNQVDDALETDTHLGRLVAFVLDPDTARKPNPPYADAVAQWERLETFVESRLRQE